MSGDSGGGLAVGVAEASVELQQREMLEAIEDAILLVGGLSGRVIEANRAGCALLGRSRKQLSAGTLFDGSAEGDAARAQLKQATETGSARFEWRGQRSDGSRFWCDVRLVRSSCSAGPGPEEPRVVAVFRDISAARAASEALRVAEERYRCLVRSIPHSAILLCDQSLRFALVDGPEVGATGFSKSAMEGKTVFEALPPEFARLVEGNLRRVLRGESFSAELPFGERWYAYNYVPIRDDAGEVLYGMILAVNVTERRQAEAALRRSEERFAKIVQASPEPMAIVRRADSVVLYANPAVESTFGWAPEELTGNTATALNIWADPGAREELLELFQREGRVDSKLVTTRRKDGTPIEGLLSLRAIEVEGVPAMLTSFRDVSELRRARVDLEASEARLRALSEATFEGIGIVDQGTVIDTNDQLASMYGTSRAAVIGRNILELVAPESRALVRSRIEQRLEGAYEHVGLRPDGSRFTVEVRAHSVLFGERPIRVTAIRDVTERKKAEAERERLIAELKARNTEMEQFTYTVSHDLRSPLVTISGFLGALERDLQEGDAARVQSDLARIRSAAGKMSALLTDLLELSRVGRVGGPLEPVSMATVAREAEELVSGALTEARIRLLIAGDLPEVRGDSARLVQVLQNLFENAAKYMGAQPEPLVELGVRPEPEHWAFFVRDNGIGIEPKYADRVFGLFEKLDPRSAGTGIGLALARRIIEFHGGTIWVESDGQQGSTFVFRLPRWAPGSTPFKAN